MATINTIYYGLLRSPVDLSVNTATATFPSYTTVVATAEGLIEDYYTFSLARDPRFNSTDYPTETFDVIAADLGITLVADDTFIAHPKVTGLDKSDRQIMKLNIAAKKRAKDSNPRDTYDINELPNPYNGNDVDPDDGASAPLTVGRPWS